MIEWNEQTIVINEDENMFLYLHTPLCGTCQLAKRMLTVIDELMPSLNIYEINLNYFPAEAKDWEIESVPCLLVFEKGILKEKIYAFQSVGYLHEKLKQYIA
ncbi:thioredoxin family protein [Metabacillus fastidiosus]|uniref:thioredoxin family protein n=1 Tax=Metabacillus fastidiosus TaxID=1458 RepID=UPI003D2ABCF4